MEKFIWAEKYRPKTLQDIILPASLKERFQTFLDQEKIPNLILFGSAGIGKTTLARLLIEEIGCDYIEINGSKDGNIDTLRTKVEQFASSASILGKRKYVLFDEADYLNPQSTQPSLRNFIETYSTNCGFIFTCNYHYKIIEPLHSRCAVIELKIPKKELPSLALEFLHKLEDILVKENVTYSKKVLIEVINLYMPDWRRILNEVQGYGKEIDTGILSKLDLHKLFTLLKEKNFSSVRRWVEENLIDANSTFKQFYAVADKYFETTYLPQLILFLAEYQYRSAFVADQTINFTAFLVEIMVSAKWL